MAAKSATAVHAPAPPCVRLSLAVTGHRIDNPAYAANEAAVAGVLAEIFDGIDAAVAAEPPLEGLGPVAPTRLHALLADGVDQLASDQALERGWELVAPSPLAAISTGRSTRGRSTPPKRAPSWPAGMA